MELLPKDQLVFDEMKNTIEKNYRKHGFLPIDTPVLEKKEVLLAKGGGETEKQVYELERGHTEMAMRFDLTVPLARYVAMHFPDLNFPFRRYHIGKVYRGERNQKGRFREFYQCDIDIIGNGKLALTNDGEIPAVIADTFKDLGFEAFTIHINNRKILNGFYGSLGIKDTVSVLRTVDKLDKIGPDKVKEELLDLGLAEDGAQRILDFIGISGTNQEIIQALRDLKIDNETFTRGLEELQEVLSYARAFGVGEDHLAVDLSIARGLDYYTGTVYETILDDYPEIGSICSGGRYENLAEHYTNQPLPGVGISIGLSRLYYQLEEAGLLKDYQTQLMDLLLIPMDDCIEETVALLGRLRQEGVQASLYGEKGKMGKKFKYADQEGYPYVLVVGPDELKHQTFTLRNMVTGQEEALKEDQIPDFLKGARKN
ncbi:MAG: histidine--tRNA ligase [Tissierellia bacterium]|nr:histidine--tRNA ligase [Tissierellia bacterium]